MGLEMKLIKIVDVIGLWVYILELNYLKFIR